MRRGRHAQNTFGLILIALGVLIILSMVLPAGFWWLALGVGLVVLGVTWSKRC